MLLQRFSSLLLFASVSLASGPPNEHALIAQIDSVIVDFWTMINPLQEAFEAGAKIMDYYDFQHYLPQHLKLKETKKPKDLKSAVRGWKEDLKTIYEVQMYIQGSIKLGRSDNSPKSIRDLLNLHDRVETMERLRDMATGRGWTKASEKTKEAIDQFEEAMHTLLQFIRDRSLPQDFKWAIDAWHRDFPLKSLARSHLDELISSGVMIHNNQWIHWAAKLLDTICTSDARDVEYARIDSKANKNDSKHADGVTAAYLFKLFKQYLYNSEQNRKFDAGAPDAYNQRLRRPKISYPRESDYTACSPRSRNETPLQKAIAGYGSPHTCHDFRQSRPWNTTFPQKAFERAYDPKSHPRGFEFMIWDMLRGQTLHATLHPLRWYPGQPPSPPVMPLSVPPNSPTSEPDFEADDDKERGMYSLYTTDVEMGSPKAAKAYQGKEESQLEDIRPWNDPNRAPVSGAINLKYHNDRVIGVRTEAMKRSY